MDGELKPNVDLKTKKPIGQGACSRPGPELTSNLRTRSTPQGGGKGGAVRKVPRTGSYGPLSKLVTSTDSRVRLESQVGAPEEVKVEGSLGLQEGGERHSKGLDVEARGNPDSGSDMVCSRAGIGGK